MVNAIKCPYCGKEFEVSEALRHQIEERVLATERAQHEKELGDARRAGEAAAAKKAHSQFELKIKELQETAGDEKKAKEKLQDELLERTRELRKARQDSETAKLEMEKHLAAEEQKIRETVRKQVLEEHDLKDKEKDLKLKEALRQVEELKTKIEQGSQQIQGEVLELELEMLLRREFPTDEIAEVKKGQRGADVTQTVIDSRGRRCGTILWELKNAQWSDGWLKKLREDAREANAQISVLVAVNLPTEIETFALRDGVWVSARKYVPGLALALRSNLVELYSQKMAAVGKNEKMEVLFQYLTGVEFRHRVEAIVEAFTLLQQDIEREKRWFQTKWSRQEKELRKIIDNTQGMYGDLQGVTGRALQEIKPLELPNPDSSNTFTEPET